MDKHLPQPTFDLEMKAWSEAFQATQKRTRTALLLSTLTSCIVLLTVFNLFESRDLRNVSSIGQSTDSSEYMKEFSRHVADEAYYQLPSLGMQITCDNVGLFGPLALLVFSLYSVMALKAYNCQIKCGTKFPNSDLTRTLLETSQFDNVFSASHLLRCSLFLPFIGCLSVIAYGFFAHVMPPTTTTDPLRDIVAKTRPRAISFDAAGVLCAVMVLIYNLRSLKFFGESERKIARSLITSERGRSTAA